jgi:hypothetical protein
LRNDHLPRQARDTHRTNINRKPFLQAEVEEQDLLEMGMKKLEVKRLMRLVQ